MNKKDNAFSSVDLVCQCLIDVDKAKSFDGALKKIVTPNSHVLDIGTGSGILALLASRAGAKKVTALEFDNYIADVARNNIKINGYEEKVTVICHDARTIKFPQKTYFDVVVMEMLTTGMVDEFQVQAINNLHKQKIIDSNTSLIPKRQETYISIANTNFNNYGFDMKMVRHLWSHDKNDGLVNTLSDRTLLSSIDFSRPVDESFSIEISISVKKSGHLNSIYLTSRTIVDDFQYLESTSSLNAAVVVPLEERMVENGEMVKVKVEYEFGYGYGQFRAKII